MKLLGFDVETSSEIVSDYILMGLPRREVMLIQTTMSYRAYLSWKLETLQDKYRELIEEKWVGRTDEDVMQMKAYSNAIRTTNRLVRDMLLVDLVKENEDD